MFFICDYTDNIVAVARTLDEARELVNHWNMVDEEGHYTVPAFFSKLEGRKVKREFKVDEKTEMEFLKNRL